MAKDDRRYPGILIQSRSRQRIADQKYFSLDQDNEMENYKKVQNRQPTPVGKTKKNEDLEIKSNQISSSAKDRVLLYNSDHNLPQFASENPSSKSQFSDKVDSHPLTEIDDYDIDENLNSIFLSIK